TVKVINVENDGKIGLSIKKAIDRPERPQRPERPRNSDRPRSRGNDFRNNSNNKENFEQKMNRFLKDSEDRLASLKRNTESKRGGRGARRG
ncbi:RNA-binding protein S1, partial [Metabacillus halosaccharovorans]